MIFCLAYSKVLFQQEVPLLLSTLASFCEMKGKYIQQIYATLFKLNFDRIEVELNDEV